MTQEESHAKQLRFIGYSDRMRRACDRMSSEALRAHYRRLHARREAMVMRGLADGAWKEHHTLRGIILDVGTQMVFTISGVLDERRQLALWVAARALRRAA
jgi:hypothetical protein